MNVVSDKTAAWRTWGARARLKGIRADRRRCVHSVVQIKNSAKGLRVFVDVHLQLLDPQYCHV